MKKTKSQYPIEDLVYNIDLPQSRDKQGKPTKENKASAKTFELLCDYGQQLRALGMEDGSISVLFSDLYWDAFSEFESKKRKKAAK